MMTKTRSLYARASATAIAAALALSPTYAAGPKPIIDLSKSPAATGQQPTAPAKPAQASNGIGPVDERTLEFGGGAIALLAIAAGAFAISRSRRRRREEAAWREAEAAPQTRDPLFDEPMFQHHEPAQAEASAFAWGNQTQPCDNPADDGSDRCPGESWVERAYRGPSPANPSASLKARLKRAAFFDKRERDVAAGKAEPVETDAGLPDTMVEEQERELA